MTGWEALAVAAAIGQGFAPRTADVSFHGPDWRRSLSDAWVNGTATYGPMLADAEPPPAEASPDDDQWATPPGGYWRPGELRAPEPPDGHEKLIVSYILIPLGTLATASGAAMTWLSAPGHCEERWARLGASLDEGQCRGLLILNAIRTTYGALMLGSGLVLLGIGLRQRQRWREWKARGGVGLWWNGEGAGVRVQWRF